MQKRAVIILFQSNNDYWWQKSILERVNFFCVFFFIRSDPLGYQPDMTTLMLSPSTISDSFHYVIIFYNNYYNHIHLITTLMLSPSTPPDSLPDSPISLRIDFAREPALPGLREWLISIYHHITFLENVFISKKYPQNRKSKPGCGTWKNRKCTNAFFSWGWAIKC